MDRDVPVREGSHDRHRGRLRPRGQGPRRDGVADHPRDHGSRLRAGDPDRAVTDGVEALLTAIEGAPWTGTATTAPPPETELSLPTLIFGGLVGVAFLIFVIKYPRKALWLLWWIVASVGASVVGSAVAGGAPEGSRRWWPVGRRRARGGW